MSRSGAIRVGIGGWTFPDWRGVFYPDGLRQRDELAHAAARLGAIEINATYYGRQKPDSYAAWAAAAPDGFLFSLKASRFSTTRKWLPDAAESVGVFIDQGFTRLGDRLGPIVWQFPATKAFDREEFAGWLDLLPAEKDGLPLRHALDVRHDSFRDEAFHALARERGAAVVLTESEDFPLIVADTADFVYWRLMGTAADARTGYRAHDLDAWAARAKAAAATGRDVFAFFIDGEKVRNPAAAQALMKRL
ncbi:DUF72 domain-containing protein [Parablastomonas sp. CN1-191]|uniref:DUF72 domain-containing protein n=1 Tax=Parablastomonas sp. CN1-191 TaxID=3400908 RepID=UPI003BF7DF04